MSRWTIIMHHHEKAYEMNVKDSYEPKIYLSLLIKTRSDYNTIYLDK